MNQELSYLLEAMMERRTQMIDNMAQGSLMDIAEYKRMCGVIQGLDFASETIKDLATRMEQHNDE